MIKKNEDRKIIIILTFVCLITIFLTPVGASATSVDFDFDFYPPDSDPAIITVLDELADTSDLPDSVLVKVTSDSDKNGVFIELLETGDHTGEFKNKALFFMEDNNRFEEGSTISLNFNDDTFTDETVGVFVISIIPTPFLLEDMRDFIDLLILTTTSPGQYEGKLKFTTTDTSIDTELQAVGGDVVYFFGPDCTFSLGFIVPNPDPMVEAIKAIAGDVVTAEYNDGNNIFIGTIEIGPPAACGGSTGGLAINRVVLDVLAGGASGGDFAPPLLTISKLNLQNLPLVGDILDFILNADTFTPITPIDDPSIDYPVSINGNGYLLTHYANTIQTYTGKTGQPVSFKMTLFDATGIEHIALYTNLRGDAREVQDSDTFIIYHEEEPLQITDPNGFFSNVNFTESDYNGKYIAEFNMTFAKPMDTSDVIIRTWDELLNSGDIKVFDAIKIEGDQIVNPDANNLIIPDSAEIVIPYYKMPHYEIPEADSEGNLVYYNSFGGLEEKQVHPHEDPITYPDYLGKAERHDDGFYDYTIADVRAQTQTMIGESFHFSDDTKKDVKFYYPSNVGKLDRENKDLLKETFSKENLKAIKIFNKKYHTNLVHD